MKVFGLIHRKWRKTLVDSRDSFKSLLHYVHMHIFKNLTLTQYYLTESVTCLATQEHHLHWRENSEVIFMILYVSCELTARIRNKTWWQANTKWLSYILFILFFYSLIVVFFTYKVTCNTRGNDQVFDLQLIIIGLYHRKVPKHKPKRHS